MTTLIISDIHNRINWIEHALKLYKEKLNYDEIVFLGDYFDSFEDNPEIAENTANWLRNSLEDPSRIHLIGNHDMPYMCPNNNSQWCPGFSHQKLKRIQPAMSGYWHMLRPAYYTQGWLLSHAGFPIELSTNPIKGILTPEELVEKAELDLNLVKGGLPAPLFLPGYRLGEATIGGITWCDWNDEFVPIPGINQIVGHTVSRNVRRALGENSINFCVDTGSNYLSWIVDGEVHYEHYTKLLKK